MSTDDGSARSTPGAAAQGAHSHTALAKLCSGRIEPPEDPVARDEFFARLLPDFDRAWGEAAQIADLDEGVRASLLWLRKGSEHAAERISHPHEGSRQALRLFAVPMLIEMDDDVPESQVDCALAWAAEAAPDAMSSLSMAGPRLASMAAFFRYQDLIIVPLTAVHEALVGAAPDGNCAMALRRMPFRARPAAARCSPIYLRFVVGVALTQGERNIDLDGSRWSTLEEVIRAVLSARLQMPVKAKAAYRPSLYGAAHDGLREYQAARLNRIITAIDGRRDISALLDLRNADTERRARLTLMRGRSALAACMLQMPLDEGPAEMVGRIAKWLRGRGVADITTLDPDAACDGSHLAILAIPV